MTPHMIPAPGVDTLDHYLGLNCWCMPSIRVCDCENNCGVTVVHAAHAIHSAPLCWQSTARSHVPTSLMRRDKHGKLYTR